MVFVALNEKGSRINLLDKTTKKILLNIPPDQLFYCPACSNPLILKRGTRRQWHFAHHASIVCLAEGESETAFHLKGKEHLYNHFKANHPDLQMETYFNEIKQRADLYFPDRQLPKVLEFQCASVPSAQILTRSLGYRSQGLDALWILGSKRLKRRGAVFRLTEMDQLCIRSSFSRSAHPFHSPFRIYYYCPVTSKFIIIDHILAVSKNTFYGRFNITSLADIQVNHLFSPLETSNDFKANKTFYLNKKAIYRLQIRSHISRAERSIREMWYERGIPFSLHPGWTGLPHSDYMSLATPPLLWQAWIYIKFFKGKPTFLLSDKKIADELKNAVDRGLFSARPLFCKQASIEQCVKTYLNQLLTLGMIRRENAYTFRVAPAAAKRVLTVNDCLHEDQLVIDYLAAAKSLK